MSILNSIATNSALHASGNRKTGTRITPDMGSSRHEGEGTLERDFVACGHRGEIVTFGNWPAEADGEPEPLQWRIIGERADGTKLAVTVDVIEQRSVHDIDGDVNWRFSSMRYWLHNVFLTHAFTPEECRRIPSVQLVTFDNPEYCTIGCYGTEDRIFCLSHEEAVRFFVTDKARRAHRTGYTKRLPSLPCWWLRSPGGRQFAFQAVNDKGVIDTNGFQATLGNVGVRPAILLAPTEDDRSNPSFCGHHAQEGAGYAIAYADEGAARHALERGKLLSSQADIAVGGGYPSILLIHRLLDDGALNARARFQICKSAIHAHEHTLFKRIIEEGAIDEYHLGQLLNTCMSEGSVDIARFLVEKGAASEGYARAYLPSATLESTAVCAVAVDPIGAIRQWEHVRRHPDAVRELVAMLSDYAMSPKERETFFLLPDLLSTCAANGFLGETYYLVSAGERYLTAGQFAEAIQEAKFHNHAELTAYLIDRQAELFGTNIGADAIRTAAAPATSENVVVIPEDSEPAPKPTPASRRPQLEL